MNAIVPTPDPGTFTTWAEALRQCQFRTLIGFPSVAAADRAADLSARISHSIAILGGDPEPISANTMAELVDAIRAGRTVLVMSDRADQRDYAKAEIMASVIGPVRGCA